LFFHTDSAIDRRNVQATFVYRYQPPFGTLQIAYQRGEILTTIAGVYIFMCSYLH